MQERFLWHFPYMERIQGVPDAMPKGRVGPLGPLALSALSVTSSAESRA
jgi:hypothetical protein